MGTVLLLSLKQEEMLTNMSSWARVWCFRLLPAVVFVISYYNTYCRLQRDVLIPSRAACSPRDGAHRWEGFGFNITRNLSLFLGLEDFFWKQYPSQLPLPYGVNGCELMLVKLLARTSSYDTLPDLRKLACRTCVVVGNGFAIKNSSLGPTINAYDVVIRLNDAPVRGYEDDVGNKTTMRFFYPESASHNPIIHNQADTLMVLVPFKPNDVRWLKEILYNEKRVRKGFWRLPPQVWEGKSNQIRVLDPYYLRQTATNLLHLPLQPKPNQKRIHPTTGILAVYVALSYCDIVHVAGFGYPQSKNLKRPIHYYGRDTMKAMVNSYHSLPQETQALKRLEDVGLIRYLHPHS